jgi:glycosyltransferase involved in cell wall biosynthesis
MELTILMPCLDEAMTLERCVQKAQSFMRRTGILGEVLVADNGSKDGSQAIARAAGARVIDVPQRGYGAALRAGIKHANGRLIILGDADDSYDFSQLDAFVDKLRAGDDLVMGNRFAGGIRPGAMPPLHRWLGNPVLSFIGRLLFKSPVSDFHCGLRGARREALLRLNLSSSGMEFASEMVVKASLGGLRIGEVPTVLHKDGRDRPPHLRTWRDGWRHLRFLLVMSPRWLFLLPGVFLLLIGVGGMLALATGPVQIGHVGLSIHTMLYAAEFALLGWQLLLFFLLARSVGSAMGVLPRKRHPERLLKFITLERGLGLGLSMVALGIGLSVHAVQLWVGTGLGTLDPTAMMRLTIPAATLVLAGAELSFASFILHFIQDLGQRAPTSCPPDA